ncbi:hypothetical protein [Candidatus Entotheonella palauensis]|uniref:hypothetical protein n=1 Tax=Candidatus Entotheonella palauensis TaxID=93172 RepID=UPI0004B3CFA1|nr:hypothetical protein [Candidatus Entotheonella palauensis]
MTFKLNTIPPGVPTWFIARTHRFTTHTHWRDGALFADDPKTRRHLGLIRAFPHERYIELAVRGPYPHNFFALLRDGLELTLARFPGLRIDRLVPCPGHDGEACDYQFHYEHLLKALDKHITHIQCLESFEEVPVQVILAGVHRHSLEVLIERFEDVRAGEGQQQDGVMDELHNLRTLMQREFIHTFQGEQRLTSTHCPNVFALHIREKISSRRWIASTAMRLQLYCQAPGFWHPCEIGGIYPIDGAWSWRKNRMEDEEGLRHYIGQLAAVFPCISPQVGPWSRSSAKTYAKRIEADKQQMRDMLTTSIKDVKLREGRRDMISERDASLALHIIRNILHNADPEHQWGGLEKILTPEGHYLWLCPYHRSEYRK